MNYIVKKYKIKNGKILIKKNVFDISEDTNFLINKDLILSTNLPLGLPTITDEEKYQMIVNNKLKRKSKVTPKKEMKLLKKVINDIILNNESNVIKYLVQEINSGELLYEDIIEKRPDLKNQIDALLL